MARKQEDPLVNGEDATAVLITELSSGVERGGWSPSGVGVDG